MIIRRRNENDDRWFASCVVIALALVASLLMLMRSCGVSGL